jgi:hypothetical protein
MKRQIKIFATGLLIVLVLSLFIVMTILPAQLVEASHNDKWLWLYTPHIIGLIYVAGRIYDENF